MNSNDTIPNTQQAPLTELVLDALTRHPQGISEYDLIQYIKSTGYLEFQNIRLLEHLSLFQTHFMLFNALYQLKDRLWHDKTGSLEICPLKILLLPYQTANTSITEHDPMRAYYLDLGNLRQTTEHDVAKLLQGFWIKMEGNEQRQAALSVLELEDPVDFAAIKQQHRRLAMRHHPDRGGDKFRLQAINAAMKVLKDAYRNT